MSFTYDDLMPCPEDSAVMKVVRWKVFGNFISLKVIEVDVIITGVLPVFGERQNTIT